MEAVEPPWNVGNLSYKRLENALESFKQVLPGFVLPSRHTLTRYVSGYFHGFHDHLPFLYLPTFRLDECAPELFLAIAAVGAQHRFENQNGLKLFDAARAVAFEQRRRRMRKFAEIRPEYRFGSTARNRGADNHGTQPQLRDLNYSQQSRYERMQTVRALLLVTAFATWEDHPEMVREATELQSSLARCLRELGMRDDTETDSDDWYEWARLEGDRRTKLIVFCLLTLHTITYNLPPVILSSGLHLRLPCSSRKWNAKSASEWQLLTASTTATTEPLFQDAFAALFSKPGRASESPTTHFASPLGNYVLILALIQRSYCIHQLSTLAPSETSSLKEQLELALQRWKLNWQESPESSLDPHNASGPIPFTATSFLALAHIRLVCDAGPHRELHTRDPLRIAAALTRLPPVERGRSSRNMVVPALLHAAHALSIPIKLGIDYVAKSQHFFWGIHHSVSSFECAVFLARWLYQIEAEGIEDGDAVGDYEKRILLWVRSIVEEAQSTMMDLLATSRRDDEDFGSAHSVALAIIKIWARIFQGNTSWALINIFGDSLELLASTMESENIWGRSSSEMETKE
ncbi:C2H2 transcription factor [Lasiodiplodia theobromae]|uniref:C2H2 transcription factor n=1 Tax=Lasiodiplodia theobromae TaxID=45133 RepID=UPI0015C3E917|nr:C2H2 transcription factor [Lasiodiplodia theobromae]KAF4537439.1 C2H2 transcription factor [Lasiodiplodia theobromae]